MQLYSTSSLLYFTVSSLKCDFSSFYHLNVAFSDSHASISSWQSGQNLKGHPQHQPHTDHRWLSTHYLTLGYAQRCSIYEKMADSWLKGFQTCLEVHLELPASSRARLLHFVFLEGPGRIVSAGSPQVQAQGAIVATFLAARAACSLANTIWLRICF